jgi:hypothetical protein
MITTTTLTVIAQPVRPLSHCRRDINTTYRGRHTDLQYNTKGSIVERRCKRIDVLLLRVEMDISLCNEYVICSAESSTLSGLTYQGRLVDVSTYPVEPLALIRSTDAIMRHEVRALGKAGPARDLTHRSHTIQTSGPSVCR